jgi:hypothetical protein
MVRCYRGKFLNDRSPGRGDGQRSEALASSAALELDCRTSMNLSKNAKLGAAALAGAVCTFLALGSFHGLEYLIGCFDRWYTSLSPASQVLVSRYARTLSIAMPAATAGIGALAARRRRNAGAAGEEPETC